LLPRHGTDYDSKPLPPFPGLCLPTHPLQCGPEEHRSRCAASPGFGRSLFALPSAGAGYDQRGERRFEFIPLWGFFVEKCSAALHILDRFHIVAKMNKALDEGSAPRKRAACSARGETGLKEVAVAASQGSFSAALGLQLARLGGKFLDEWCRQTMRSRIEPMKKIARSLRHHREPILNYFRAQKLISSGVVEGMNNKAKVTIRKSYGFRTYRVLKLALYHSLGKLPEPESTHDFF
jgi:transposase